MGETFKGIAYEILREAGKPLHSDEITKIGYGSFPLLIS